MTITKALMYARISSATGTGTGLYRRARIGAFRMGYYGPMTLLKVAGTLRSHNFDRNTWRVTERGRGQGITLTIEMFGFTPVVGDEVILGAGAITNRLFRGTITRIRQARNKLNQGRVVWSCQCVDWTYQLGNLKVTKKYTSTSATTIAQSLITLFAPAGFTSTAVQSGLATINDIQFTMQTLPSALQNLADRLGAYWYVDFDKVLHFYTAEALALTPKTIDNTNKHTHALTHDRDIEGLFNRIIVEGAGSPVAGDLPIGTTFIPVTDGSQFADDGAPLKVGQQITLYTGKTRVVQAPLAGPTVTLETYPTPPAPTLSAGGVAGALTVGATYKYKYTWTTGYGQTAASEEASFVCPASGSIRMEDTATPTALQLVIGSSSGNAYRTLAGGSVFHLVGGFGGHFIVDTASDASIAAGAAPPTSGNASNLAASTVIQYAWSYATAAGETLVGPATSVTTGASGGDFALWTGIPDPFDETVTSAKLYRKDGAAAFKLDNTFVNPTRSLFRNTTIYDTISPLGANALSSSTAGNSAMTMLSGVPALTQAVIAGEEANMLLIANDVTSQGLYGIREYYVQDRRLSKAGGLERAAAELALRKDPRVSGSFGSSDPYIHAGAPITINVTEWGLTATVTAQTVTISPQPDRAQPIKQVDYASRTPEDLFTQLREIREQLAR